MQVVWNGTIARERSYVRLSSDQQRSIWDLDVAERMESVDFRPKKAKKKQPRFRYGPWGRGTVFDDRGRWCIAWYFEGKRCRYRLPPGSTHEQAVAELLKRRDGPGPGPRQSFEGICQACGKFGWLTMSGFCYGHNAQPRPNSCYGLWKIMNRWGISLEQAKLRSPRWQQDHPEASHG